MTIHCVTPNPAVDITYRVDELAVHAVNRVRDVTRRPGGKGVNVARLVASHGSDSAAYGFLGGQTGRQLKELLAALEPKLAQRWTDTDAETRLTIAVVDDLNTTMFNEPGRPVTGADWALLASTVTGACRPGDVVTISGSLPAGADPGELGRLVAGARECGATVIVDTSGPALLEAAAAGADVLKPNHHELLEVTGTSDVSAGIAALLHAGARAVVASLGSDGLVLGTPRRTVSASLGKRLQGNPTGAGDALVAGLAAHLAGGDADLPTRLVDALPQAVAWSAAAVTAPVAGEVDLALADRLTHLVSIKDI